MPDIQTIIDKYGPTLWAAAQRQVQIDITVNYLWAGFAGFLLLVAGIVLVRVWTYKSPRDRYSTWNYEEKIFASIVPVIVLFIAFILGTTALNAAIQAQLNPVYAAYQHLLPQPAD